MPLLLLLLMLLPAPPPLPPPPLPPPLLPLWPRVARALRANRPASRVRAGKEGRPCDMHCDLRARKPRPAGKRRTGALRFCVVCAPGGGVLRSCRACAAIRLFFLHKCARRVVRLRF